MKKYNILHIVNIRFFNATAWYAMNLCRILNKMGHCSTCLVLEGTEAHKKAIEMDIPYIAMPYNQKSPYSLPKIYAFLKKILNEQKPDIVNCHRGELYPLFVRFKKKFNYKLVRTRGDQRPAKNNIINRFLYSDYTDSIISTNSVTARQLINDLNVPAHKVHIILGGVDTENFYPNPQVYLQTREKFGYSKQDCVVGLLGRLDPVKGVKESIEALARIASKAPFLKLCVIGFDELLTSEEVMQIALENNVADSVKITGKVSEVNHVLNMCDVAILSSIGSETIARAALEFIACDIPLISSKVGVMPDLVDKEALFETADVESMAETLYKAYLAFENSSSEEGMWLQKIKNFQQTQLKNLSLEAFADQSLNVYLPLLNK